MFQDDYGILRILARPAINERYSLCANFVVFFVLRSFLILVNVFRYLKAFFKCVIVDAPQIDHEVLIPIQKMTVMEVNKQRYV